jgi:hypothetical protein
MKPIIGNVILSTRNAKLFEWGKLIARVGSIQLLIQAISLVSGILIIRLLPTKEYALYTIANTMLGTMIILADGGISAGVMSQGGKVWQDRNKLGEVLATGLNLRKNHHGASWLIATLIVIAVIPSFTTSLSTTILEIAPKLHQDLSPLQKNQTFSNIAKLILTSTMLFFFPLSFTIILVSSFPQIWYNRKLQNISTRYVNLNQKPNIDVHRIIISFVKRILPGSIYYCLSGQITIWLISLFGSTNAVAQIGALSRLAMILSVMSVLFSTIILPRFARLPNDSSILLKKYIQIQFSLHIVSIIIIICVWVFPSEALWILGNKYSNLTHEVTLSVINSCLGLIAGSSFNICNSRGWAINPLISIPITITAIIIGIALFDISSLRGILILNIFVGSVESVMYFTYSIRKTLLLNK